MGAFDKLLSGNPGLWDSIGFYTFFLGVFLLVAILLPLLFEKERFLLPSIVVSFVLVGAIAWALEHQGPLLPKGKDVFKVVYVNKEVKVMVPVPTPVPGQPQAPRTVVVREQPRPSVSVQYEGGTGTQRYVVGPQPSAQPQPTPTAAPQPQPAAQPQPVAAAPAPVAAPPAPARAAPEPAAAPAPTPVANPTPSAPPPEPAAARAQPSSPAPSSAPSREPSGPSGERTEEGLVLPTGNLVIQITSTLLLVAPGEASKAVMSVFVDGRGVAGRKASSMRIQNDEAGNVLNVTYFWKGATIRMSNLTTGNHKVSVTITVVGEGFKKSKTAWSGTVYVGEGATATVVLQGGYGDTLSRVQ